MPDLLDSEKSEIQQSTVIDVTLAFYYTKAFVHNSKNYLPDRDQNFTYYLQYVV